MVFFETCGPNEAMVVSGMCHSRPALVTGGRIFVWPVVQKLQKISLNTMTLNVESPKVYTRHGVPISVTGIAQVKIQGQNQEMLHAACQQFLGKSTEQMRHIALETLEGHQRAIMGTMTVEEIYRDRKKFSKSVFEVASSDLVNMGISIVSYTIKDIRDDEGYLHALGMARTAQVKRDARIGEAEAHRDSGTKEIARREKELEATVRQPAEAEKYKVEKLAEANRNRVVLEAEAQAEAIKVKGEAEAFAIEAKAKAEAEQMAKKADAWKEYREAAVVDMVLETLPKIAAEVAAPISQCNKITMVSNGKGEVGASKITSEILDIVANLPKAVESLTGIDISKEEFLCRQ
ncbi:Flotillin-1 [Exaiptasia diaphana]|nr:Flotillin-1 [Exaiptasia diaphana]